MKKNKLKSLLSRLEESSTPANDDMVISINQEMAKRILTHYGGLKGGNGTCSNNGSCSGNEKCSNNGKCSANESCQS